MTERKAAKEKNAKDLAVAERVLNAVSRRVEDDQRLLLAAIAAEIARAEREGDPC